MPGEAEEHVLDVGGGTGHLARAYATVVALAVVVDLTPEMLAVGKANCDVHGQRNVLFVCANAASLPFLAESFDLVVSRLAVHHFERPMLQIAEMARVCRPGGRVGIIDLIAAEPALCAAQDRLERMRDPSHTRALPLGGAHRADRGCRPRSHCACRARPPRTHRALAFADKHTGRHWRSDPGGADGRTGRRCANGHAPPPQARRALPDSALGDRCRPKTRLTRLIAASPTVILLASSQARRPSLVGRALATPCSG